MDFVEIFSNKMLITTTVAWLLAQAIKLPIDYIRRREVNWALLLSTGGMPSSHSALVTAAAHSIGLYNGFDSAAFVLGFVLAMVVVYDATGIRRQAGQHAALINAIINDLATGHPIKEKQEKQLKEVLGHTPLEAVGGVVWGLLISTIIWMLWT